MLPVLVVIPVVVPVVVELVKLSRNHGAGESQSGADGSQLEKPRGPCTCNKGQEKYIDSARLS